MGGGKNNDATTTTKTEPWSGVKPFLLNAYKDAQNIYKQGAPSYYPGQTVAPMSDYSRQALDQMAARAQAGSPITQAAQGQLTDTLSGKYLQDGNPYLKGAIDAATRPILDAYTNTIMPGIDSQAASMGRYGGDAWGSQQSNAAQNVLRQVGDVGSQLSYQNYGDERQRQIQGMLFAPELANADYNDITKLGQAGAGLDQYNQSLINADVNKYNFNQNKDWNFANQYIGLLNGNNYNTQSQTAQQPSANPFTTALGGAATGAGLGSMFGPVGTGVGALGGALIGGLGSLWG